MKKERVWLALVLILVAVPFFTTISPVLGASINVQETELVNIYFFWGEGCPYCETAKPYLAEMANSNPNIMVHDFEIYNDAANRDLFFAFAEAYGIEPRAVPTFFIGERQWVGFNNNILAEMQQTVQTCLDSKCNDLGQALYTPSAQGDVGLEANNSGLRVPQAVIIIGSVVGFVALFFVVDRVFLKKKK